MTANVIITGIDCVAVDAANQETVFEGLKDQVRTGTFTGTPFDTDGIGEAGSYQFFTYTASDGGAAAENHRCQVGRGRGGDDPDHEGDA